MLVLLYQFSKAQDEIPQAGSRCKVQPLITPFLIAENLQSNFPISPIHLSTAKCWAELLTVLVGSGFFWLIET